jgi:hypothetical protein
MNSISKITISNVYTYADKKGTVPFPVEALSRVEGTKTKVIVRDVTIPVPGKVYVAPGPPYEFEAHIAHLTGTPVEEARKSFVPGSHEHNNFNNFND